MIVKKLDSLKGIECPKGGFTSYRATTKSDGIGYTMTHTIVHPNAGVQMWHYKNHVESCYCIRGNATLTNADTKEVHTITAGVFYILDKNDRHTFEAHEETHLVCVFLPALVGDEIHREDGSYGTV
jgi:L-ectoine synthase